MTARTNGPPQSEVPAPTGTGTHHDGQVDSANTTGPSSTRIYLNAVYGERAGRVHIAVGSDPHRTDTGKYAFGRWSEHTFAWPAEADQLEREIRRAAHDSDVYLCVSLMHADKRTPAAAVARTLLHADVDGGALDLDKARQLGAFVVGSGSLRNGHVYVPLAEPIPAHWHRALECGLVAFLGADPAKISANDLLRPPGTFNNKPTVGGGGPVPVEFLIEPTGAVMDVHTVAGLLGVTLPAVDDTAAAGAGSAGPITAEPVDLSRFPRVKDALDQVTSPPDRSADTARVVGAAYDCGLTFPQTCYAVNTRPDLAARLAERPTGDDDVRRCWDKIDTDRRRKRLDDDEFFAPYKRAQVLDESPAAVDADETAIRQRLRTLQVDAEARRRLTEANAPAIVLPPTKNLTALLAEPDAETAYRVDRVAPEDARILLSAQYKAGKTTLVGNYGRTLVDGGQFLGQFTVNAPAAGLVLIDNELSEHTLRRWLRAQGIRNTGAVADVVALRGQVGTFDPLDDRTRTRWARRFADVGADYLVLDCLRPVLDALGLDEHHDAGKFLVAFDALLDEAGIRNAMVVHHMGHSNERARGDSRLQDWPDAIWRLVRETDDPASPRYFTAYGRDVEVPEGRLDFDGATRRLTYTEGSREESQAADSAHEALHHVVGALVADHLDDGDGMNTRAILGALAVKRIGNRRAQDGLALGVDRGVIALTVGARGAKIYRLANPCERCGNPVAEADRHTHRACE